MCVGGGVEWECRRRSPGAPPYQLREGSWQMSLSQCHCLCCHFLFWVTGEGESHQLPATLPESGTALVQNGPVSIFDFPWGLTGRSVAPQVLWRRTQGSRGSSPCPPGPSNVLGRKETLTKTQCEIPIPGSSQIEGKGGPGRTSGEGWYPTKLRFHHQKAPWQWANCTFASGFLQIIRAL